MNQSTHPSTALLAGYIDSPESNDFYALRLHLSQCTECRNQTMKLTKLNHNITHYLPRILEPELESGLEPEHEPDNHYALKSALHSATHSAAMGRYLNSTVFNEASPNVDHARSQDISQSGTPVTGNPEKKSSNKIFVKIADFFTLAPPVWLSVPITAAVVFSLTLMLPPISDNKAAITLLTYQDKPVIIFEKTHQALPGIGFFNDIFTSTNQKEEAFSSISVALENDNSLHIKWRPIANASSYRFSLYLIEGKDKKLIGELTTDTAEAVFLKPEIISGRRYEWLITGKTTNDLSFKTEGGFIVANNNIAITDSGNNQ